MTTLTITKSGILELDSPIKVSKIGLKLITLFANIYNLTEPTVYQAKDSEEKTTIPPGYYTYEELQRYMPNDFKFDKNTLKITTEGTITGGLQKLIKDEYLYLSPLFLFMFVDGIDTSCNLLNGKRSNILSIIPIGTTNVTEIFTYQPLGPDYKKIYNNKISHLNIGIKDEHGNDYKGKFIAVIELHK